VYFVEFPQQDGSTGYGEDWHPSIATHQLMAERLTAEIKTSLDGKRILKDGLCLMAGVIFMPALQVKEKVTGKTRLNLAVKYGIIILYNILYIIRHIIWHILF